MKKTTYILIGILGLLVLTAFFGPVILFQKRDRGQILSDNTLATPIPTDSFSSLSVSFEKWPVLQENPLIEIVESDSATTPAIALAKVLKDNARTQVADDELKIIIDLHTAAPDDAAGYNVRWNNDTTPLAIVTVPKGMLKTLDTGSVQVRLHRFTTPVETLCDNVTLTSDSRIPLLTARCKQSYISVTTDTGSSIDTVIAALQSNCSIDLRDAKVATILNRPDKNATSTIILNNNTEIKP